MVSRNRRISVVAKNAVVSDGALPEGMAGRVVARRHPPITAFFGIPRDWQLEEAAVGSAMEVGARVDSGTEEIINLRFVDVGLFAFVSNLIAALVVIAVALNHLEIRVRGRMVEAVVLLVVFDRVFRTGMRERLRHARVAVRLIDAGMAPDALFGVDVTGVGR